MEIEELQKKVVEFRDARDWAQYYTPKDLAISVSLEAAELLEIFQWTDTQEVNAAKRDPEKRRRVKEELGDVLIYALNMCHAFGFGLSDAILEQIQPRDTMLKIPVSNFPSSPGGYYGQN